MVGKSALGRGRDVKIDSALTNLSHGSLGDPLEESVPFYLSTDSPEILQSMDPRYGAPFSGFFPEELTPILCNGCFLRLWPLPSVGVLFPELGEPIDQQVLYIGRDMGPYEPWTIMLSDPSFNPRWNAILSPRWRAKVVTLF